MSDKILNYYTFDKDDNNIIKHNFKSYLDWDKACFENIKNKVKTFLRVQQNNKCCYCKKELGHDIKEVDIEHIIPKSTYEKFTFHKANLALSCPGCNTIKSDKNILQKNYINYPLNSKQIKIIHAYYDNYSEHIRIENDCLFVPLSKKGSETITICELFRLITVEQKAKEKLIKNNDDTLLKQVLSLPNNEIADFINKVINRKIIK